MCEITNQLKKLRKHWMMIARVGVSVGIIAFLANKIQWAEMRDANVQWRPWLMGLGIFMVLHTLCSVRWYMLLHPLERATKMLKCFTLYFEGMLFSMFLPSTIGGDVVKAFRVSPTKTGRVLAMCSLIVDRLSGLVAVLIIGGAAMAAKEWKLDLWQGIGLGVAMFAASCAVAWIGLSSLGWLMRKLNDTSKLKKTLQKLEAYSSRPILVCRAFAISIVIQFLNAVSVYYIGNALGINLPLSVYCEVVPTVALLVVVPISVGGLGVREALMAYFLGAYGVKEGLSVLLSINWTILNVIAALTGLVYYWFSGSSKIDKAELEASQELGSIESTQQSSSRTQNHQLQKAA
jgi:glycosyltransferase 2 family protein